MTRAEIEAAALVIIRAANPWTPEAVAKALAEQLAPLDLKARYDVLVKENARLHGEIAAMRKELDALRPKADARPKTQGGGDGALGTDKGSRFSPKIICSAFGIPHGTLGSWAKRGYLKSFDAAHTIAGKARQFTTADALALALLRDASVVVGQSRQRAGEPCNRLASACRDAAAAWLSDRERTSELRILRSGDTDSILVAGNRVQDPMPTDWIVGRSYNLHAIFSAAIASLHQQVDGGGDGA